MDKRVTKLVRLIIENGLAATNEELENQFKFFADELGMSETEISDAINNPWFPKFKGE